MSAPRHSSFLATRPPLRWLYAYRWRVGIRPRLRSPASAGDMRGFTFLEATPGHFHADPFIIEHDQRIFLFYEEYSYLTRSGKLVCAELDASCAVLESRTILQKPYHLSYPHVFAFNGSFYMIPETAAANRVDLYRAVNFPWEWRFQRTLLSGSKFHDVTSLQLGGKQWILAGGSSTGLSGQYDQLHLFHAPTIFDEMTAHRSNPVKTDLGSARPAGSIMQVGNRIIRPAQDCRRWYGCGLTFMEIEEISESFYSERALARLPEVQHKDGSLGTHTYNSSENFEAIDSCSYGIEIAAIIGRARSLGHRVEDASELLPETTGQYRP